MVSLNSSHGGVPKSPVEEARVFVDGMEHDRQKNLKYHGGPDRALCLYSAELIEALQGEGHQIRPGTIGENVLIAGVDWREMTEGVRLRLGAAEIELTAFAHPCRNIAGSFRDGRIERVSPKVHPGWSRVYAKVVMPGILAAGDQAIVL